MTEGDLAPVGCVESGAVPCERVCECRTYAMWKRFGKITNEYFDSITLESLMSNEASSFYVI